MSDDFTGSSQAGNASAPPTVWTAVASAPQPSTFLPYPSSGQFASDEVGYGQGGYGEGGYDAPGAPSISPITTVWTHFSLR